jgi:hypothetical protein
MQVLENPVSVGQVYIDKEESLFVKINDIWVDEDVETQVKVKQYHEKYLKGSPVISDSNSCERYDRYDGERTLHITDITGRIFGDELELVD